MEAKEQYVFNYRMYTDCAQYSMINRNATRVCTTLSGMGGVSALLALPTSAFTIICEIVLLAGFSRSLKRSAKQHIYGGFECAFGIIFTLYFGVWDMFFTKGLPWLGYEPYFSVGENSYACKFKRTVRCFITTCVANIIYGDAVNRATAIKSKCYQPVTGAKAALIMCCCVVGGLVASAPEFLVCDNWNIDGRLTCGKSPRWAPIVIQWLIWHEFFLINGAAQSLATFLLVAAMARDIGKLDNTIDYLHTAHRLPEPITETMFQVTFLLRESRRDAWVSVIFNLSMACLMTVRALLKLLLNFEIYIDFKDNGRTQGVLNFYMISALDDLVLYLMIIVFGYQFWLYFYYIPGVRTWVFGETPDEKGLIRRQIDQFLPIDPDSQEYQTMWDSSSLYMDKGDPKLYDRISNVERVIRETEIIFNKEE